MDKTPISACCGAEIVPCQSVKHSGMVRCIKCGTHIHDVERNDDCYVCKRCGRAASDGDGFIGQPCYPNLAHAPKDEKHTCNEFGGMIDCKGCHPAKNWDSSEGKTHSENDGCGEIAHNAPKEEKQSIEEIVADIVKTYQMYEYIDFVGRSSSAKGTINWAEEVARFLVKECPDILSKFPLYAKGEYERGKNEPKDPLPSTTNKTIEDKSAWRKTLEQDYMDDVINFDAYSDALIAHAHAAGVEEFRKKAIHTIDKLEVYNTKGMTWEIAKREILKALESLGSN